MKIHRFGQKGFSMTELLVTLAIIGLLAATVVVALGPIRKKARDSKRKNDLAQIGRFFSLGCIRPDAGDGEYDAADLIAELKAKNPQYGQSAANFKDPKTGTDTVSNYKYIVSDNGQRCALYANLENENEPVTLSAISAPTPGGGRGVFVGAAEGWNGSDKFYQYSN